MLVRVCPKCGGLNVHRSRRRGLREHLFSIALLRPFRCFDCDTRYMGWRFGKSMASPDVKRVKKHRAHAD